VFTEIDHKTHKEFNYPFVFFLVPFCGSPALTMCTGQKARVWWYAKTLSVVFSHQRQILRIFTRPKQQTVLFFGTHSGLVSDSAQ
jgi:hypothetical protein